MHGTLGEFFEEWLKRPGHDSESPVVSAQPVVDFMLANSLQPNNISDHRIIENDRFLNNGRILGITPPTT